MKVNEINQQKLLKLKENEKFNKDSNSFYPSTTKEIRIKLNLVINDSIDKILFKLNSNPNKKSILQIIKQDLKLLDKFNLDTEDKEKVCEYYDLICEYIGIDSTDGILNSWLYGNVLGTLVQISNIFRKKSQTIEVNAQQCRECNNELQVSITERGKSIPEFWVIVKCNNCDCYNLMSIGPDVKSHRFENCKEIEYLNKTEYNKQEANSRLNKIQV